MCERFRVRIARANIRTCAELYEQSAVAVSLQIVCSSNPFSLIPWNSTRIITASVPDHYVFHRLQAWAARALSFERVSRFEESNNATRENQPRYREYSNNKTYYKVTTIVIDVKEKNIHTAIINIRRSLYIVNCGNCERTSFFCILILRLILFYFHDQLWKTKHNFSSKYENDCDRLFCEVEENKFIMAKKIFWEPREIRFVLSKMSC